MQDFSKAPPELETLRDFVRWAASRFQEAGLTFGHGTENAVDEAAALVLHTLHLPHGAANGFWDARLTAAEREAVTARIRRRIEGRLPLPYITHEAWFAGLPFYVDERVLVPRSPLAEPIREGFAPWLEAGSVSRVLDLCTGSACIAIACAYAFEQAQVDAVEISDDALEVARINVERHGLGDRVELINSDLFDSVPTERRYQLIISNPPYVDAQDMARLTEEFRREPELGLTGGDDGLDLVRRILAQAGDFLTPDGILVVEVGNSAPALEAAYPNVPFLWLEFEHGGGGVFLLTAEQIEQHRDSFVA